MLASVSISSGEAGVGRASVGTGDWATTTAQLKRAVAAKFQGNGTAIIRDRASGTWQAFREPEEGRAAEAE
jgi:hypothetical protein